MEQWNRDDGTVEYVMVEQCNLGGGTVDLRWWKSERPDYGTVEQSRWKSRKADGGTEKHVMVEEWNIWRSNNGTSDGGMVEQMW